MIIFTPWSRNWKGSRKSEGKMFFSSCVLLCLLNLLSLSSELPFGGKAASLYGPDDEVYSLTVDTIYDQIFSSPRSWLVEFYSSWCGHCVNFAPKWKQFAQDLKTWKSVVVVAAIDCADETNIPACRAFDILGYPTLKLFGPMSPRLVKDAEGTNLTLNTGEMFKRPNSMSQLKYNLIDQLGPMFPKILKPIPNLAPFTDASDLWNSPELKNGPNFLLVLFESNNSYVGREVALRLSNYHDEVRVLRYSEKNRLYESLGLDGWPAAGYLTRDSNSGQILLKKNQDLVDLLTKSTMELAKVDVNKEIQVIEEPPHNRPQKPNNDEDDESESHLKLINGEADKSEVVDRVSMEDLLHTVRNALRNEVALNQRLDGVKLKALRDFLAILSQYFPADRREVRLFLGKLSDWVRPLKQIEVNQFTEKLDELEETYKPWDIDLSSWEDCKGTVPGRRGYTCGLWRLFHTLTVVALDKTEDAAVLPAIAGYVKNFFGCQECSTHFETMLRRDNILDNRSIRDQTMWLWKAHNEVNLRLKGTPSEDPAYPKGYYPSRKLCPECYPGASNDQLDEGKVEEYLLKVYSRPQRVVPAPSRLIMEEGEAYPKSRSKNSWLGGFFSITDIGIFMIVYLSIALLLVLGYVHFRSSSKSRRRITDPVTCLRRMCSPRSNV